MKNPVIGIGSIVLPTEPTEYTRKMQLDTEYTEVSTERTEICLKKLPKGTSTQQVIINSGITTPYVFLPALLPDSVISVTRSVCGI